MKNAFFIHTPLQLFVAQQIIRQEGLAGNILIYSYVEGNEHFLKIYDMIKIDEYWDKCVFNKNLPVIGNVLLHNPLRSYIEVQKLKKYFKKEKISSLYISDIKNISCCFYSFIFNRMNVKINIYEEGSSHYSDQLINRNTFKNLTAIFFLDYFYYLPFYSFRFGKYIFHTNKISNDKVLPINIRYNILPYFSENYDKRLVVEPLFSSKTNDYLEYEINQCKKYNESPLLLTQPFDDNDNEDVVIKTIDKYISSYFNYSHLFIKFHPRDKMEFKNKIIEILNNNNIEYTVLGKEYNIPIEYYLQKELFNVIINFFSSVVMYNGYMYYHRS